MTISGFYFTDTIALTNLTQDPVYGEKTGVERTVECRIEVHNKLITNSQGQDIRTHTFIMMGPKEVINEGDRFRILTKNGVTYRDTTKTFQVKVVFDNTHFGLGNIEVAA